METTISDPKFDYNLRSVSGKAVVVTGGTTGIGRAIALLMAARGARVLTFGRDEKALQDALRDIQGEGRQVFGLTADVAVKEDIQKVFREVDEKLGGVDILVNNAALGGESVADTDYDQFDYIIRTNLLGYMGCAREAVERMKRKGEGHIVNIGSMSSQVREPGSDVYVATKAAIQGFSESLRKRVNEHGIKVSLIEPGLVGTEMIGQTPEEQRQKQEALEEMKAEDIAEAVYYCVTQPKRCDVVSVQIRPHRQLI